MYTEQKFGRTLERWSGKFFKNGLIYLSFNPKALTTGDDVKPSMDEIELFKDAK